MADREADVFARLKAWLDASTDFRHMRITFYHGRWVVTLVDKAGRGRRQTVNCLRHTDAIMHALEFMEEGNR